jgi:hypothetical protein
LKFFLIMATNKPIISLLLKPTQIKQPGIVPSPIAFTLPVASSVAVAPIASVVVEQPAVQLAAAVPSPPGKQVSPTPYSSYSYSRSAFPTQTAAATASSSGGDTANNVMIIALVVVAVFVFIGKYLEIATVIGCRFVVNA